MAVEYSWPTKEKSHAIGKRVKRLDGMAKSTGAAKYTYDVNLKNQLIAKGLGCPHASCTIKSIDMAPAQEGGRRRRSDAAEEREATRSNFRAI